jgi:hypothetical protein
MKTIWVTFLDRIRLTDDAANKTRHAARVAPHQFRLGRRILGFARRTRSINAALSLVTAAGGVAAS